MSSQPSRPVFARKFGRGLRPFDGNSAQSLCFRELGKINVDCTFRSSESKWGVLGEERRPAGIIYMDLTFHQPKGYRLSSATVLVTLQEVESPSLQRPKSRSNNHLVNYPAVIPGSLRMDKFGPKKITGEPKSKIRKSNIHLTPNITVMGSGGGGMGKDTEEFCTYTSRWIFEGKMVPGDKAPDGTMGSTYKTLRWDLSENDLDMGVEHPSEFHTGFSFEHQKKPCYLKVEIDGKLQKKRHQLKNRLKFPPSHRKDQGSALTWIGLDKTDQFKTSLDPFAASLSRELEWKNYEEISMQFPDALSAKFSEVPSTEQPGQSPSIPETTLLESVSSVDTSQQSDTITPPAGLLNQNAPSLDPMIMYLGRGNIVFGGPAGVRQQIDQEPVSQLRDSSVAFAAPNFSGQSMDLPRFQYQDKYSPTPQSGFIREESITVVGVEGETDRMLGEKKDPDGRRTALLPILILIQFLANVLDYFGENSPLVESSSNRKN